MRVLVVRVGAMGDVLHALPAVAALRHARPEWFIDWVVDERWQPLLDSDVRGPIVDVAFRVPIKSWKARPFSRATLSSLFEFRNLRGKYDAVIDMQGTMRSAVIGRLAGGSRLAGFADPRESLAAALYGRKIVRRGTHVVEQGAALLGEALGVELRPTDFALPRIEWAENWAEQEAVVRRPMALLAADAGWGAKQWPVERFGALAGALRERGYDVVVNARRKDDAIPGAVVAASGGAARAVMCNVAGLVALMRRCDLVIGGDSGPVHLAAALAVPLVALFGPTSPERNGPWGPGAKRVLRHPESRTSYKRVAEVDPGLAKIGVEEVMGAVESLRRI